MFGLYVELSVQRVKSHGSHFACLCRGFEFYEVFFFLSFLEKEDGNTFTLLIIFIHSEKSSKRAKKHKSTTMTPNLPE